MIKQILRRRIEDILCFILIKDGLFSVVLERNGPDVFCLVIPFVVSCHRS